ncbi:acyl-Coenzyme A dehydrogenase [Tieghemostelium lacteum]|uniref:Short/branched chain specific acyl-CoA dehydrogenase, mitochondrial n=1 Tax=Tieghemostelium lacteum TaxID=361077 RepID=A0A151Z4U6_TIELA|nr:acyl-Coenzyme A dehydrogenase [Tieghemostelium lacteum]|eukprot:KYQ88993.1 acyl-Coenzyme A dehydrogenase [Tieghemostelium lacteum]
MLSTLIKNNTKTVNIIKRTLVSSGTGNKCYYSSNSSIGNSDGLKPVTTLTAVEMALRDTVQQYSMEKIKPLVKKMDAESYLDKGILKDLFEMGLMGIEIPEKYQGPGLNFMSSVVVIEELAKIDPAISVIVDVQNTLVNNCINRYGTEEQRSKYLPRLAKDMVGSFCLSEQGSGSDAFAMKTRAEKNGDYYILNGTKAWITNAKEAGVFIVMANENPSVGYKGITAFIVDRDTPGLSIGKKEDKLGIRASSTCEVILQDVKVPVSNVLGQVGKGYKIAIEGLNEGRIGIAAQMLGLAQGCFDSTLPYLIQRHQFGKSIAEFQGVQFTYADLAVEIEAARLLTYNAARLQENKLPFVHQASMAKLYSSRVAEKTASACISMLGGVGYTKEYDAEKFFRDSKVGQIYEGTTNIQLQVIGKHILNKYKSEL